MSLAYIYLQTVFLKAIEVHSRPGQGFFFVFVIPVAFIDDYFLIQRGTTRANQTTSGISKV